MFPIDHQERSAPWFQKQVLAKKIPGPVGSRHSLVTRRDLISERQQIAAYTSVKGDCAFEGRAAGKSGIVIDRSNVFPQHWQCLVRTECSQFELCNGDRSAEVGAAVAV